MLRKTIFIFILLHLVLNGQDKDSTLVKPDTTSTIEEAKPDTSNIIEDVKTYSKKDNFFSKMLRFFFIAENGDTVEKKEGYRKLYSYKNKIIRKININVLDVFGSSVYRQNREPSNWLQKTANSIHINTKEWLIKNRLLFSENTKLNPFELAETERFLRQNNFIYDARIVVESLNHTNDSVDINVYVQDVWSISGDAAYSPNGSGFLLAKDNNFLGLGSELSAKIKKDESYKRDWNWDGRLFINNIARTFFSTTLYNSTWANAYEYGMNINRDFFSPIIKLAGGAGLHWRSDDLIFQVDTNNITQNTLYINRDIWFGYAFKLFTKTFSSFAPNNFSISARIIRTDFLRKPSLDTNNYFRDNTLYLARAGYADRGFYKDEYIFGLGRTEDIPVGKIFSAVIGYQTSENISQPYFGIDAGYSTFRYQVGYFYAGFQAGSFRYQKRWIDADIHLQLLYISRLFHWGTFKIRHYGWSRYYYIMNPLFGNNTLNLNNMEGLRGFNTDAVGNKKIVINYENSTFLPISFLNFKIAIISFIDVGVLSAQDKSLIKAKLYKGFGFGIRIRNEHLVFGTVQLMFGFYPNSSGNQFDYFSQSRSFYQFNQFQFTKPEIIRFR